MSGVINCQTNTEQVGKPKEFLRCCKMMIIVGLVGLLLYVGLNVFSSDTHGSAMLPFAINVAALILLAVSGYLMSGRHIKQGAYLLIAGLVVYSLLAVAVFVFGPEVFGLSTGDVVMGADNMLKYIPREYFGSDSHLVIVAVSDILCVRVLNMARR